MDGLVWKVLAASVTRVVTSRRLKGWAQLGLLTGAPSCSLPGMGGSQLPYKAALSSQETEVLRLLQDLALQVPPCHFLPILLANEPLRPAQVWGDGVRLMLPGRSNGNLWLFLIDHIVYLDRRVIERRKAGSWMMGR